MIQKLIDLKDWITDRLEERTTWDGGVLVAVGLVILFLGSSSVFTSTDAEYLP